MEISLFVSEENKMLILYMMMMDFVLLNKDCSSASVDWSLQPYFGYILLWNIKS